MEVTYRSTRVTRRRSSRWSERRKRVHWGLIIELFIVSGGEGGGW